MRSLRPLALLALQAALCPLLHGLSPQAGVVPFLSGGGPGSAQAMDLVSGERSRTYRFTVDSDTYGVDFRMSGAIADLDLVVRNPRGEEAVRKESPDYNEQFFLDRMEGPGLMEGTWEVEVRYALGELPVHDGRVASIITWNQEFRKITTGRARKVAPGDLVEGVLDPRDGMMASFQLDVAGAGDRLRLDVLDSRADLDFYVFPGSPGGDPLRAPWRARSYGTREYLALDLVQARKSHPEWDGRSLGVVVLSAMDTMPAGFTLLATRDQGVPARIAGLPAPAELRRGIPGSPGTGIGDGNLREPEGLDRAVRATVEIMGENGSGTGCVVSPRGLVLTSLHVLRGADGIVAPTVAIGFSSDLSKAPDSQFRARLAGEDRLRDLALLRIETGFYGQPLPGGYAFPWMPMADGSLPGLGAELYFSGYPLMGGLGSRSTLTLSRGIVAGWEDRGFGLLMKTDGLIAPGSSGGAALDRQGRLVGVPTMVVTDSGSRVAWVTPVALVPESWRDMVERDVASFREE